MLAQWGIDQGDSNCLVHAQLLLHHLHHRRSLKQHAAILAREQKISHEARQVERRFLIKEKVYSSPLFQPPTFLPSGSLELARL